MEGHFVNQAVHSLQLCQSQADMAYSMYFCCEAGSGYISRMNMYSGKQGNTAEKDHCVNVVLELISVFHGHGHSVYMYGQYFPYIFKRGET